MITLIKVPLLATLVAAAVILGGTTTAHAVLVGNTSGGPHSLLTINPDATTVAGFAQSWTLGSEQAPVSVEFLAGEGLWLNDLAGSPPLQIGQTIQLHEFMQIADGGPSWIDWNQRFVTEGFNFLSGTLSVNGNLVANGVISQPDKNTINYNFAPLPSGTIIEVIKDFVWVGSAGGSNGTIFQGAPNVIQLEQFPTPVVPEPATLAMIGLGLSLTGIGSKFWKRKKAVCA